jgi:hypothetical protein
MAAERQDRLVLEEQQLIADRAGGAGRNETMLEVPRVAIPSPAEPPGGDRRGCAGNPI